MGNDKTGAYAAAELGSKLRGEDPGENVRSFAGLIDDRRTLALLNYYDGLIDAPIEETEIGRLIIQNAATRTIDEAVRHGSVSQMKSATGLTGQERDGGDLYAAAANELTHEGAIGLVFGSPGSGKTATTLDVAQSWKVRTGGSLIGNTSWDGYDRVVRSDREMLEAMANIEGPVLAVLDEIAQELSGFGSGNKAAEQFSDSLLFIRKKEERHGPHPKRGSVLLVGHTRTKTAKSIRRVASFAINKPSRSDPGVARLLESEGGKDEFTEAGDYKGLTDTAENYPEHEASEFDIILEDDEDGDDAIDVDEVRKQEHIATAIRAADGGATYDEVAELVPYSSDWVGKVYRNWRDGKRHTEIVPRENAPADD
ncbi:hypothetical protein SAMN04488066_10349 [Halorubrum aquaticum]|uniref:Uncharacterized protein n=1 Tax=Halorubrum aquaticum TaxID=387340 RepID=A0A1I2ZRJ7_9EURY|nr:ATP-binding protein [Halorubrum aquaticum]SFH40428.1 hypothetical protein SAMN04488066_10349 [Halorubrum aquaticum]